MATWINKFPWLDQKYVQEIEQRTANIPAWAKEMMQQKMYSDFYAQQQREKEQAERLSMKNQLAQRELEAQWDEKKALKLQQKKWNLADVIRNFYKLTVSDWDDNSLIEKFTNWIKDWTKMYVDYLNGDNNDIMIQTWLLWDTAKKLYNLPWNRLNPNSSNQNVTSTAIEAQKKNQPTATLSSTSHFDDPEYAAYYIDKAPEDFKQFIEESRKAGKDDTWIASVIDGYQVYTDKLQKYEDFENRPLPDRWEEIAVGIPQGFVNFFANAYNNLFANNPSIWLTAGKNIDMDKIQFTDELLWSTNNYGDLRAESWWTKTWEFGGEMWANLLLFHYLPMPWEWVKLESIAESTLKEWTKWALKNIGNRMIYGAAEWAEFGELASMGQENVTWTDVAKNTALWAWFGSVFWLFWAGGNAWKYRNTLKTLAKEWDKEWTIKGLLDMYNRWIKPTSQWVKTNTQLQQYNDDAMWAVESIIKNKDALKYIDANWEETFWHLPRTVDEFSQAIKQTKQSIYDRYAAIAKEAWQTTNVDTSDIVTALKKQLKDKEWRAGQSEATIGKMEKWIKDLEELNNTMSVEWAQAKVQELNQKIQAFLKSQNPNDVSPNAVDGLVLNGLKKGIDDAIEKAGLDSEEYIQLRNMYRQLKSIESDVNHRAVVYGRQNPQSLVDSMSDLQTIDAIADIFSNPIWWTIKLAKTKAFKLAAKDRNNSNKIVENMFKDADDTISKTNTLKSQTQIANERTQRQQYNIRKSRQQRLEEANYRRTQMERARQEIAEKQAQQEQEYQNYLKFRESLEKPDRPWLWYNEWFNWEPTTTIIWTPEWTNIRSWRWEIAETPTKNVNYAENIPEDKITLTPKQIDKISKWELDSEWANQLVALHNLSLDNLKKTADLWGLPMPSVAVTRRWVPHESYWDISLVLKKEAIDPATNKANKLFSVDAYTATVPQPKYLPKGWKEAKEIISSIQKETGLSYWEVNQWIEFPAEYERMYPELKKYSDLHDKVADKKLFEWYTNAGSRRYKDYTLDNVVKNMKKDDGRTAFWNFGKLVWDERWKLKWLSDARNIEYKATDTKSYWKLANEYNDAKRDVYNSITDEDSFLDFDVFNDIVESSFNKNDKKRLENINKELNGDFWYELSLDDVQKIHKPIQDWAKLQRPYAEAKPERPVKFDEVSYVLAPEEQAAEVEKLLWDKVQVVSYKASEWRAAKLEELQKKYGNVFFWLWWSIFPISYLLGSNWDTEQGNTIKA